MNTARSLFLVLLAGATVVGSSDLAAHGGRYRGAPSFNGPTPPPGPGQNAPPPPAPRPYTPPPVFTPVPVAPGSGVAPNPTTPRGAPLTPDLGRWQLWWEMNKDAYLSVKSAVRTSGPVSGSDEYFLGATRRPTIVTSTPHDKHATDRILPALHRALLDTNNPDLVTSCLIGLAKIGKDHHTFKLLQVLEHYLSSGNYEIRETAALGLGVSRRTGALPLLRDLLLDTAMGRQICKRSAVGSRMRAFAAYGIGILAAHGDVDVRGKAAAVLRQALATTTVRDRDIQVAVVSALGVLGLRPSQSSKEKRLLWQTLPVLSAFYAADLGKGSQLVQAHVPVAMSRLLGRDDSAEHRRLLGDFVAALSGLSGADRKRFHSLVQQSHVIAIGRMARSSDAAAVEAVRHYFRFGRNEQARYFSLIAMGEIGGDTNRTRLLSVLAKGKKALERPWAAMALGVLAHKARTSSSKGGAVDRTIGDALLHQLVAARNKEAAGAFAVALGLAGYAEAAPRMREILEANRIHDAFAGHLCIGLALMGDRGAIPGIRQILHRAVRRPQLLRNASIALGILQDRQAVPHLLEMLEGENKNTARMAAVAGALQYIGDRRTVDKLIGMLNDRELTKLARAFAAAALGGIADPMDLPFATRYAADCNYRAVVETLTDGATGILDIL